MLAFAKALIAQQDPQFTQYMYNPVVINPAYAGNRGVMSIVGLHRSQWVGLDGAPRTQTLSMHTPMGSESRVGLGLSIVNDEIGPSDETYFTIDFSYTIPVGEKGNLSFGLKGGGHLLNVDYSQLNPFDVSDPNLQNNIDNQLSPMVGAGLYYHDGRFHFGLSAPNLLQTEHANQEARTTTSFIARERTHYFATAGYVFDINENIKFKPATMLKMVPGSPLQWDASANFLFNDKLTLGAAYRWSAAVSGLVGFQISEQMMIGFAYDRETTELGNAIYNDGSYELFMRYELFNSYDKIVTPRFF